MIFEAKAILYACQRINKQQKDLIMNNIEHRIQAAAKVFVENIFAELSKHSLDDILNLSQRGSSAKPSIRSTLGTFLPPSSPPRSYSASKRTEILGHASTHGVMAASKKFGVSRYTIYIWRQKGQGREGAAETMSEKTEVEVGGEKVSPEKDVRKAVIITKKVKGREKFYATEEDGDKTPIITSSFRRRDVVATLKRKGFALVEVDAS